MSWARYITGWAAVKASGAEPEKLLRALAERDIPFWDAAAPKDYSLTVKVPERALKYLPALAASAGCEAAVLGHHGLPSVLRKVRRRYALFGCIALVLALLFVGSAFLWEIDITGNETIPDGVIRQALSECGVDIGAFWPAFSQDQIRNSVILHVPGIRWMTVTVRGSHAKVIVREARTHLPVVDEDEYVNIVAAKAGLVENVQALRGTPLTDETRAVLPGETLIAGYTTGRFGVLGPTRAIGAVTARTWYELTAQAAAEEAQKDYGGYHAGQWALILGKTRINFYKGSSICPAGCDKIILEHALARDGVFALPVTLEHTVYVPYETHQAQSDDMRQTMEAQLMDTLLAAIGEDGEILSQKFTASQSDGTMYVTLRAECREQIGREVPLTEEDLWEIQLKIPNTEEEDDSD